MPRKPPKLREDVNEIALRTVMAATGAGEKPLPRANRTEPNAEAVRRGRKGGKVGGKARSAKLSAKRRGEICYGSAFRSGAVSLTLVSSLPVSIPTPEEPPRVAPPLGCAGLAEPSAP